LSAINGYMGKRVKNIHAVGKASTPD
jgi:hypothetical protein